MPRHCPITGTNQLYFFEKKGISARKEPEFTEKVTVNGKSDSNVKVTIIPETAYCKPIHKIGDG